MDQPAFLAVLERVRWHNVARAGAVAGIVALVLLWPRLATPGPEVPAGLATPALAGDAPVVAPVVSAAPVTTASAPERFTAPAPRRPQARRRPKHRASPRTPHRAPATPRPTHPRPPAVLRAVPRSSAAAPTPAARVAPTPPPPVRSPAPSGREFVPGHHDFTG